MINNAGLVQGKTALEMSEVEANKTMVVNAESHFWTVKEFLPSMVQRNSGHVVSIASMAGKVGQVGLSDYCASKFAAYGFNECLRLEMKAMGKRIPCTTICPSYINTGMFAGIQCPPLLPLLNQLTVADRIVQAILQEENVVCIPWWSGLTNHLLRLIGNGWLVDLTIWFVAGYKGMSKFKGRTGPSAPMKLTGIPS